MDKPMMIAGGALLALGILYAVVAIVKRADAYEHLGAWFITQWGMMLLMQNMFEANLPRLGVIVFFAISMAWTYVMWWKARREWAKRNDTSSAGGTRVGT